MKIFDFHTGVWVCGGIGVWVRASPELAACGFLMKRFKYVEDYV